MILLKNIYRFAKLGAFQLILTHYCTQKRQQRKKIKIVLQNEIERQKDRRKAEGKRKKKRQEKNTDLRALNLLSVGSSLLAQVALVESLDNRNLNTILLVKDLGQEKSECSHTDIHKHTHTH